MGALSRCSEMTLESKLDQLTGFKELEVLDVTLVCKDIGVEELE